MTPKRSKLRRASHSAVSFQSSEAQQRVVDVAAHSQEAKPLPTARSSDASSPNSVQRQRTTPGRVRSLSQGQQPMVAVDTPLFPRFQSSRHPHSPSQTSGPSTLPTTASRTLPPSFGMAQSPILTRSSSSTKVAAPHLQSSSTEALTGSISSDATSAVTPQPPHAGTISASASPSPPACPTPTPTVLDYLTLDLLATRTLNSLSEILAKVLDDTALNGHESPMEHWVRWSTSALWRRAAKDWVSFRSFTLATFSAATQGLFLDTRQWTQTGLFLTSDQEQYCQKIIRRANLALFMFPVLGRFVWGEALQGSDTGPRWDIRLLPEGFSAAECQGTPLSSTLEMAMQQVQHALLGFIPYVVLPWAAAADAALLDTLVALLTWSCIGHGALGSPNESAARCQQYLDGQQPVVKALLDALDQLPMPHDLKTAKTRYFNPRNQFQRRLGHLRKRFQAPTEPEDWQDCTWAALATTIYLHVTSIADTMPILNPAGLWQLHTPSSQWPTDPPNPARLAGSDPEDEADNVSWEGFVQSDTVDAQGVQDTLHLDAAQARVAGRLSSAELNDRMTAASPIVPFRRHLPTLQDVLVPHTSPLKRARVPPTPMRRLLGAVDSLNQVVNDPLERVCEAINQELRNSRHDASATRYQRLAFHPRPKDDSDAEAAEELRYWDTFATSGDMLDSRLTGRHRGPSTSSHSHSHSSLAASHPVRDSPRSPSPPPVYSGAKRKWVHNLDTPSPTRNPRPKRRKTGDYSAALPGPSIIFPTRYSPVRRLPERYGRSSGASSPRSTYSTNQAPRYNGIPLYPPGRPSRGLPPWSSEEITALEQGMEDFGTHWTQILYRHGQNGTVSQVLAKRTTLTIKDKARSIRRWRERHHLDLGVYGLVS
ncbi:TTAGGG repeat binding factor [Dimargaris verticillata]|uniref:TTAGGG repeat binding factor n=1 Tax=Dimargaris verticillata TaxID=2761393 RepID=A0A9W8BAW3_9FUNG|nr:TTAGGG repeat binding factor [Dimargaris verticillata]